MFVYILSPYDVLCVSVLQALTQDLCCVQNVLCDNECCNKLEFSNPIKKLSFFDSVAGKFRGVFSNVCQCIDEWSAELCKGIVGIVPFHPSCFTQHLQFLLSFSLFVFIFNSILLILLEVNFYLFFECPLSLR